jgi:hypothetical protein
MKKIIPILIPIILIILFAGGFFIYQYYQKHPKVEPTKWLDYSNVDLKIKLNYPETFKSIKLTEDDNKAKIIFKAEQPMPSALFSLRHEDKLGVLKLAQKSSVLEVLKQSFENQYPSRFTDFKKEKEEKITIDGNEAEQFYFTYLGKDNTTRMKQRFVIVVKQYENNNLGTVAFYLSFQSKESDFNNLDSTFGQVLTSFKFL